MQRSSAYESREAPFQEIYTTWRCGESWTMYTGNFFLCVLPCFEQFVFIILLPPRCMAWIDFAALGYLLHSAGRHSQLLAFFRQKWGGGDVANLSLVAFFGPYDANDTLWIDVSWYLTFFFGLAIQLFCLLPLDEEEEIEHHIFITPSDINNSHSHTHLISCWSIWGRDGEE